MAKISMDRIAGFLKINKINPANPEQSCHPV